MGDINLAEDHWDVVHGHSRPASKGVGVWIWETLKGDFQEERSYGQIGADMVISLVPLVGTAASLRDLVANIKKFIHNPKDKLILLFIAVTLISFIPEAGAIFKGVFKIIFLYLRRFMKDAADLTDATRLARATARAVDAALPKIIEFLQDSRVVRWATNGKVPDLIRFAATQMSTLAGKIDGAMIKAAFDKASDTLVNLLTRIHGIVPADIATGIEDFLKAFDKVRLQIKNGLDGAIKPLRVVMQTAAKRLEDHALIAESRVINQGWLAPMSEKGAAVLMNKEPPKWVRLGRMGHQAYSSTEADAFAAYIKSEVAAAKAAGKDYPYPMLSAHQVTTFERKMLQKIAIPGPKKIYRIVDPTSQGGGDFWVSEEVFKKLKSRADWRDKLAVKPDWNQNGQYVVYDIPTGETLYAWKGPAGSQKLNGTPYHLEGGYEQIVFKPEPDEFKATLPNIDPGSGAIKTGKYGPDTSIGFTDVTGEATPTRLREKIVDPHITGPFPTNWGFSDWTAEDAQRIIIELPHDIQ